MNFKVGDQVHVVGDFATFFHGETGTILAVESFSSSSGPVYLVGFPGEQNYLSHRHLAAARAHYAQRDLL